jgi:hypothetical protein
LEERLLPELSYPCGGFVQEAEEHRQHSLRVELERRWGTHVSNEHPQQSNGLQSNKTVPVLAPNVLQDYPHLDKKERKKGWRDFDSGISTVEYMDGWLVTLVGEQDLTIASSASWTSFLMNALVSIIFERSPSASPLSRKTSIPGPRPTNISLKVDVACRLSAVRMFRRQPFVARWTTFDRAEKTAGSDRESEEEDNSANFSSPSTRSDQRDSWRRVEIDSSCLICRISSSLSPDPFVGGGDGLSRIRGLKTSATPVSSWRRSLTRWMKSECRRGSFIFFFSRISTGS